MKTTFRTTSLGFAVTVVALSFANIAQAGGAILTEAVNTYNACCGGSSNCNLMNRLTNADGYTQLIGSGLFPGISQLTEGDVHPSHFHDPDVPGALSAANDQFDRLGYAFSIYSGHGTGTIADTSYGGYAPYVPGVPSYGYYRVPVAGEQLCSSAANCTSPVAGGSTPAICRRIPGETFGHCSYTSYTRNLLTGDCSSPYPSGTANISGGKVKWGELVNANGNGGWAGAGTNAGTNVVVMDISFAHMVGRAHELFPAFAGIQLYLSPWIVQGDTADVALRGYEFGLQATLNPSSGVAQAWLASLSGTSGGTDCIGPQLVTGPNGAQYQVISYGGGHGINGCGGLAAVAVDATQGAADASTLRSFANIRNDNFNALGNGFHTTLKVCNYNCAAWSETL